MKVIYAHSSIIFVRKNSNPSSQLPISCFPEALTDSSGIYFNTSNSLKQPLVLLLFEFSVLGVIYWLWQWNCWGKGSGNARSVKQCRLEPTSGRTGRVHGEACSSQAWPDTSRMCSGEGHLHCPCCSLGAGASWGEHNNGVYTDERGMQWRSTPCSSVPAASGSHTPVLIDPVQRGACVPVNSLPGNQEERLGSPVGNPVVLLLHCPILLVATSYFG